MYIQVSATRPVRQTEARGDQMACLANGVAELHMKGGVFYDVDGESAHKCGPVCT